MKRKFIMYILLFLFVSVAIKVFDIQKRYDISFLDYIKYSMPLTEQEKDFLKSKKLTYGLDINDAPFGFVSDSTRQNTGIIVDYFNQLSVILENQFTPVENDRIHLALNLKNQRMDVAVLNNTPINGNVFLFTQALYMERSKLLLDGDSKYEKLGELQNMRIAVVSGSTAHHAANEFFASIGGLSSRKITLILTENLNESLSLLDNGTVDGIIGDEAKISYELNQSIKAKRYKFLEEAISEEEVCAAVNSDQQLLFSILNKGILEMKRTNQYGHIHSKWFGSFIPEMNIEQSSNIQANSIIILLALFFVFFGWNQTVSQKVTQRTRQLKESREELRFIMDSLTDGIMVTDSKDIIRVCNKSIALILHSDFEQLVGKSIYEIPLMDNFLKAANEKDGVEFEGKFFLVYHRKLNISANEKLIFFEDYTQRRKHEQLNRQEAKMIAVGELSAGLAHEIRNPLGLIKSYNYVLKKKVTDSTGIHAISVMDESVDRINTLIENLLGFSRLSMEQTVEVDIENLLTQILMLEKKTLEKNNIRLETKFELGATKRFRINDDIVKLALANLINNSIDALVESGKPQMYIRIRIWVKNGSLNIDFSDNGKGISKDNMETIFDPFFTTKESGTGLGLYILQSELRAINGSIEVESIEDEQTTFYIKMPIESENENEQK